MSKNKKTSFLRWGLALIFLLIFSVVVYIFDTKEHLKDGLVASSTLIFLWLGTMLEKKIETLRKGKRLQGFSWFFFFLVVLAVGVLFSMWLANLVDAWFCRC